MYVAIKIEKIALYFGINGVTSTNVWWSCDRPIPGPFPAPPPKPGKSVLLRTTSVAMQDMGLQWNPKKCTVIHVRKGKQAKDAAELKLEETALVENFKT